MIWIGFQRKTFFSLALPRVDTKAAVAALHRELPPRGARDGELHLVPPQSAVRTIARRHFEGAPKVERPSGSTARENKDVEIIQEDKCKKT